MPFWPPPPAQTKYCVFPATLLFTTVNAAAPPGGPAGLVPFWTPPGPPAPPTKVAVIVTAQLGAVTVVEVPASTVVVDGVPWAAAGRPPPHLRRLR